MSTNVCNIEEDLMEELYIGYHIELGDKIEVLDGLDCYMRPCIVIGEHMELIQK